MSCVPRHHNVASSRGCRKSSDRAVQVNTLPSASRASVYQRSLHRYLFTNASGTSTHATHGSATPRPPSASSHSSTSSRSQHPQRHSYASPPSQNNPYRSNNQPSRATQRQSTDLNPNASLLQMGAIHHPYHNPMAYPTSVVLDDDLSYPAPHPQQRALTQRQVQPQPQPQPRPRPQQQQPRQQQQQQPPLQPRAQPTRPPVVVSYNSAPRSSSSSRRPSSPNRTRSNQGEQERRAQEARTREMIARMLALRARDEPTPRG